ncbi:carboxypeptidase M32 [Alicyclobacillus pomorum]|uniref:carboxypeptidase M32 n=1 Tax=Alicyclobacillus pomorum TaxID=204470 RepID=UPI0003F8B174|nr:carboxypeptidase M32 [Alicyclobacillus pomorum]
MATARTQKTLQEFREYVRKMLHYQEALALMYWDLRTGAPRKGHELRAEAIGTLSSKVFRMSTSHQMEEYLNVLSDPSAFAELTPVDQATVREVRKEFDRSKKIPAKRYQEYVVLVSKSESVWEEAKSTGNFEQFRPYLEQVVAMNIEFVGYWGYKDNKYDTLLDMYEPGITVKQLDEIFGALRNETVRLLQAIVSSGKKPNVNMFEGHFDVQKQRELSLLMLENIGYDFGAGRLDETAHPFQTSINRFDTRVTTRFLPNNLRGALFATIHEGGHALYEQGISTNLIGTPLCTGASMGIHESQSRFYENIIGRSREFWEANFQHVQRLFPEAFGDVTLDEFHFAINNVQPSLIRILADELTYNLHIMLRYELEKGLINSQVKVADLPELWREKMKEYLGIIPETDAEGVLQDMHWSGGLFGYFPSYSLGNIYAAQFRNALAKEVPDFMEQVRKGELSGICEWLQNKIHRHGKLLQPADIVQQVTGEPINAKYLVSYLKEKFSPLYGM